MLNWCAFPFCTSTDKQMVFISIQQGTCLATGKPQNGAVSGVVRISPGNERELLEAVATVGPVAAAVDATSNAFRVRTSDLD